MALETEQMHRADSRMPASLKTTRKWLKTQLRMLERVELDRGRRTHRVHARPQRPSMLVDREGSASTMSTCMYRETCQLKRWAPHVKRLRSDRSRAETRRLRRTSRARELAMANETETTVTVGTTSGGDINSTRVEAVLLAAESQHMCYSRRIRDGDSPVSSRPPRVSV